MDTREWSVPLPTEARHPASGLESMGTVMNDDVWSEQGLRLWLDAHRAEMTEFLGDQGDSLDERIDKSSALLGYLDAAGVTGWGWPVACGGRGGTAIHRAVFYDVLTRAGFAMPESAAATEVLGSALIRYSPVLAARYLPAILAGRELWCQGFSEPEAGSDLASLRTIARPAEGGWVITGQKVWTSLGHRADWCGVLARTGDADSRHRGLTLFWVDMRAPGVTVRPLRALTGEDDFSELFLDEVFVPADHLVSAPDQGWEAAMYLLQFERGMWAWQRQAIMHSMLEEAIHRSGDLAAHAASIGRAYLSLASLRIKCMATVTRLAEGENLGPEVSADKVVLSQTEHIVNDVIRELTPGFSTSDDPHVRGDRREWFYSRASSVYGGAVEIQKNIIARRVLGLPQEARHG